LIGSASLPRPFLSGLLLAVALLSWYLSDSDNKKPAGQEETLPHVAKYFVRDLSMTSMGIDGQPERHIESSYVVQYLDDETTEMAAPVYMFYRTDQPPWHVQAERGWLSADGELALLSGRVTILRAASATTAPFKLVTSDLRIQPGNNYVETDNPVEANSGQDRITATGMQAWMGEPGRIKFLSNVRATYVPR
jgi:lipopolysaccharide export system protein LptC